MEFVYDIKLKDTGVEFNLKQWSEAKRYYQAALRNLNNFQEDLDAPVATKSFIEDYNLSDDPTYKAKFWTEISDYIKEKEGDSWAYSHILEEEIDANTDPYDDYELVCTKYIVYAKIFGDKPDVREALGYKELLEVVKMLHGELLVLKDRIDNNCRG